MVLLYDNECLQHLGKLCMHWLGPFIIKEVLQNGVVQLQTLQGQPLKGHIHGIHLKPYMGSRDTTRKWQGWSCCCVHHNVMTCFVIYSSCLILEGITPTLRIPT